MTLTVITQPQPLVTLEEAKLACGVDHSERDEQIAGLVLAAQAALDGPHGELGITVAQQTIEVYFDRFCDQMKLPCGPVIAPIIAVTYVDEDGAEQPLDASTYILLSNGTVILGHNQTWPPTLPRPEAVKITYEAGIADEDDPRIEQMKSAMKLHVKKALDMVDDEAYDRSIRNLTGSMKVYGL